MIGRTLYAVAEMMLRRRQNNAAYGAMMALDDRALEDIGVPRGRIAQVVNQGKRA